MSRSTILLLTSLFVLLFSFVSAKEKRAKLTEIIIENAEMKLVIGTNGKAISLKHKLTGQECLEKGTDVPDEQVAVNVLATDEFARIDAFPNKNYQLLYAGMENSVKLMGVGAALLTNIDKNSADIRAFMFERGGKSWVVYWHVRGEGLLRIPINTSKLILHSKYF